MLSENNDEGFEYEDDEDDEGFEDDEDDEGLEDDEAFGAMEDDEDDESFEDDERVDDESTEDDERVDDEATFVASPVGVRARLEARQTAQARAVIAGQRAAARQAVASGQMLSRKIGKIHGAGPIRVQGPGRLAGSGVLTAELPNGRRTKMRLSPAPASIRDVNKIAARVAANGRRQAKAEAANSRAINKLAAAQAAAVKQLTAAQVRSDAQLAKRLADGDKRIDARITKELTGKGGLGVQQRKMLMRVMKTQRRRAIWNTITIASALPFFIAYGDRKELFGKNNLILAGSLGGWLLIDELVDQFTGKGRKAGGWTTGADVWSYVAPFGNAATAYLLLKDGQHERFVTGVAKIPVAADNVVVVSSDPLPITVGKDVSEEFAKREDVRVLATINGAPKGTAGIAGVQAKVTGGKLVVSLLPDTDAKMAGQTVEVAYVVDTQRVATA